MDSANPVDVIKQVSGIYGIPDYIPLTIALHESGLNPSANVVDTNGAYSTGLFQLNQKGVGAGYSPSQLTDPYLNARLAIQRMLPAYQQGVQKGLSGFDLVKYVANNSGWPGNLGTSWTDANTTYNQGLARAYAEVTGGKIPSTFPSATGTSSGSSGSIFDGSLADKVQGIFWMAVGGLLVLVGIFVATNPLANLSNVIEKVGMRSA